MLQKLLQFFRSGAHRARSLPSLSEESRGHFFSWFHLVPDGNPKTAGSGTCVTFRPSGPAFHALLHLDVMLRDADQIVGSELWVKRSLIDGKQSSFARDIVVSFLGWALEDQETQAIQALISAIANMRAANERVIIRADAMPPLPSADRTGGYAVFMGEREHSTIAFGHAHLTLRNVTSDDHSRWLSVRIAN